MAAIRSGGDLTGEPFFAAVRRRHPDIDIVLLPGEPPAGEPSATREELEALPGAIEHQLVELWPAVAHGLDFPERPQARYRFGTAEASVRCEVAAVRVDVPLDLGMAALAHAGRALTKLGWAVAGPQDGVPRLAAERAGGVRRTLLLAYAPQTGAYSVALGTEPLQVGRAAARRLVRRSRAEQR